MNDPHLTIYALDMAVKRRCPGVGPPPPPPLRPRVYLPSEDYQKLLAAKGIVCSMSGRFNPYDNAVMEVWNSTFKAECGER